MVAFSANYASFGQSNAGHFSFVFWTAGEDLYGIWEAASHDSHFRLRSGGPCRCLPVLTPQTGSTMYTKL